MRSQLANYPANSPAELATATDTIWSQSSSQVSVAAMTVAEVTSGCPRSGVGGSQGHQAQAPKSGSEAGKKKWPATTPWRLMFSVFTTLILDPSPEIQGQLPLDSRKLEPHRCHPKHWWPIVLPASATTCKTAVNSDLIFLPDSLSKRVFLADSGASLSIVPYKSQAHPFGPTLRSASGASISAWGYKFGKTRFNRWFSVGRRG